MLISFKCMFCRPDMNTESATKNDMEESIERIQKMFKKKNKINFMSRVIQERQVY